MIRVDRSILVEAVFKLGSCVESLAHPYDKGDVGASFKNEQIENVRAAMRDVMVLLSKEPA